MALKGSNKAGQLRALFARGVLRSKGKGKSRKVSYNKGANATDARKSGRTRKNAALSGGKSNSGVPGNGRFVIGGKTAGLRGGSSGGKKDYSGTRASRIAAGKQRAENFLGQAPQPVDRKLAARAPSYGRQRTELGKVQAALRTRVAAKDIDAAARQIVNLPGAASRKRGEAPGARGTLVRNLRREGKTAYTAQARGNQILKAVQTSQRKVYDTPGLSGQEQKRAYAIRKRREDKVKALLRRYGQRG